MTLPSPANKPTPLVVACPNACSLNREKIGAEATAVLLSMRQNGAGAPTMVKRAEALLGRKVVMGTMQRHLKHYREARPEAADPNEVGPRPNDVAILDEIIVAGWRHSKSWRPTMRDMLDAMKLKVQMTGQSAFEDMLTAMNEAFDLPDEDEEPTPEATENPEALGAAEERGAEDQEEV